MSDPIPETPVVDEPIAEPTPEPTPEPQPQPEPIAEPEPQPEPIPEPEPTPEPTSPWPTIPLPLPDHVRPGDQVQPTEPPADATRPGIWSMVQVWSDDGWSGGYFAWRSLGDTELHYYRTYLARLDRWDAIAAATADLNGDHLGLPVIRAIQGLTETVADLVDHLREGNVLPGIAPGPVLIPEGWSWDDAPAPGSFPIVDGIPLPAFPAPR